jgi:hypothetical protein
MRKKRAPEQVQGAFLAMPHSVLDSVAFTALPGLAKALLLELGRQLNGSNNGHLHASQAYLGRRGWTSHRQIAKHLQALVDHGLVVETHKGGLNIGPTRYAVTWLPVSDYSGLDIAHGSFAPGAWRRLGSIEIASASPTVGAVNARRGSKPPAPQWGQYTPHSGVSTSPTVGLVDAVTDPTVGSKTPVFGASANPTVGNNVICQSTESFSDGGEQCGNGALMEHHSVSAGGKS